MKTPLCWALGTVICVTSVAVASLAVGHAQSAPTNNAASGLVKDKLIGAWRLAWIEEEGSDGKPNRLVNRRGTLVYTRDGHMSVQIMLPEAETAPQGGPVQYDQGGYEAYYGTYDVNEQAHSVTHHVEGALVRKLIGNNLTRVYSFSNGQLILKSSRPDEHWTIAWEHY